MSVSLRLLCGLWCLSLGCAHDRTTSTANASAASDSTTYRRLLSWRDVAMSICRASADMAGSCSLRPTTGQRGSREWEG